MKDNDITSAVISHPKYQELLQRRNKISMLFFIITLIIYAGFVLTLAFDPVLFGQPIAQGMTMSIGIFSGILVVISAIILVAIYVYYSNKIFDPLLQQIIKDVL